MNSNTSEQSGVFGQGGKGDTPFVQPEDFKTKKRTVREFLSQYRHRGLATAKKFRKQTKLQKAEFKNAALQIALGQALLLIRKCADTFKALKDENNWVVAAEGYESKNGGEVIWIGDGDPLEIIKGAEKEIARALHGTEEKAKVA